MCRGLTIQDCRQTTVYVDGLPAATIPLKRKDLIPRYVGNEIIQCKTIRFSLATSLDSDREQDSYYSLSGELDTNTSYPPIRELRD